MASAIVLPVYTVETDQPVVDALTVAKTEITALQSGAAPNAPVAVTAATLAVTAAAHAGRVVMLNRAASQAVTLPAATGTGNTYEFILGITVTTPSTTIKVANVSDAFIGFSQGVSDDPATCKGFIAVPATDDTVTLNGTTTGGYVGDKVIVKDVALNVFSVEVRGKQTGTEATPFSATV